METVNKLLKWFEKPIELMLWIGLLAAIAMMFHVTADVSMRTIFNSPVEGTTEIVSGWYMVAIAFLPWAWIEKNDSHIVAGMFEHVGGPVFGYWLGIFVKICTLLFLLVFVWETWVRALQQVRAGEVWQAAGFFIPIWPSRLMLPISGLVMGIYLLLKLVRDVAAGPPRTN
jgi:TRAP-type C4-dicarboxylate transport system permease small subunit